jgi:two-component system sensor histidine kinase KdpD
LPNTGVENNSALIFVLAVVIISSMTEGFFFGILASLVSTVCINWFFMYPYGDFNLSLTGYPVAIISTLTCALVVCTLTYRTKLHARMAEDRERKTKELYQQNAILEKEKNSMEISRAKADVRSNILLSVSHDLRTPLTAIAGAASVVLSQDPQEHLEENFELIRGIKDQAEWMSIMVENIISVAKLGGQDTELQLKPEIPDEIIESCVIKIRRLFPDDDIRLHLSEEIVLVYAEPILIRQVLQNLLENAIRHSESTQPYEVITEKMPDGLRFAVRDHGIGIPEEIRNQINQSDSIFMDEIRDGDHRRGIGISACQSILKAHGSQLLVSEVPGGGTEFSFTLKTAEMEL